MILIVHYPPEIIESEKNRVKIPFIRHYEGEKLVWCFGLAAVFIFPERGNLPPTGFIAKCLSSFRLYVVSRIREQKCSV